MFAQKGEWRVNQNCFIFQTLPINILNVNLNSTKLDSENAALEYEPTSLTASLEKSLAVMQS